MTETKALLCDAGCGKPATRMYPNGEGTAFLCWLDGVASDSHPGAEDEPPGFLMQGLEQEDARQRSEFLAQQGVPTEEPTLSEDDKKVKEASQRVFSAVANLATMRHIHNETKGNRNSKAEDIYESARNFRDAETSFGEAVQAFMATYVEVMLK